MRVLPSTMPTGSLGKPGSLGRPANVGRAQDFSTAQLKQHKERAAATTSVGRAIERSRGAGPRTSVNHVGRSAQSAATSIAHPTGRPTDAQTSANHAMSTTGTDGQNVVNESQDQKRYEFARRKIMQRKAQERKNAAKGN